MLQCEAQMLTKKGKENIARCNVHSHKNCISLIPFHITQAISKKIHQFVKDILHRNKSAIHLNLEKPLKSCKSEISSCRIHNIFLDQIVSLQKVRGTYILYILI